MMGKPIVQFAQDSGTTLKPAPLLVQNGWNES